MEQILKRNISCIQRSSPGLRITTRLEFLTQGIQISFFHGNWLVMNSLMFSIEMELNQPNSRLLLILFQVLVARDFLGESMLEMTGMLLRGRNPAFLTKNQLCDQNDPIHPRTERVSSTRTLSDSCSEYPTERSKHITTTKDIPQHFMNAD